MKVALRASKSREAQPESFSWSLDVSCDRAYVSEDALLDDEEDSAGPSIQSTRHTHSSGGNTSHPLRGCNRVADPRYGYALFEP